jgi:polyisoprenoid-binding protein YceI
MVEIAANVSSRPGFGHVKNSQWLPVVASLAVSLEVEAAEQYQLDAGNTQVAFVVQYLGIRWVTARFSDISGEFVIDRTGPASRVDVSVGVGSLDCSEPSWNERLRSTEWLDVQHYPRMIYHSISIERSEQRAVANGELTLHGVTRPIVLEVIFLECPAAGSCQFTAHGRIRRSEYGLPHGFWTGGDQVDVNISGSLDNRRGQ